jgi:hypothetical protein
MGGLRVVAAVLLCLLALPALGQSPANPPVGSSVDVRWGECWAQLGAGAGGWG